MIHNEVLEKHKKAGPLSGLKVLDISTIVAAPTAASLLGDYGAQVIKVEHPKKGDPLRSFAPFKDGKPLWWKVLNRDKQLISLDLSQAEGRDILLKLVSMSDVLIENFRPGTLDKWGLTANALFQSQPRLIILRATAFGQNGPYCKRPGFARVFEAMSGLTYISGDSDGPPMHMGYPIGDSIGGLFGALGIMVALSKLKDNKHAPGEEIDLSMTEALVKLLDFQSAFYELTGKWQERSGNTSQYAAPTGVYKTLDGHWVSLSGSTESLFQANCRAINRSDLINDKQFLTNKDRSTNADSINLIFSEWFKAHNLDYILKRFQQYQGSLAPIYSAKQVMNDEQIKARRFLQKAQDKDFGTVSIPGIVPRFSSHFSVKSHTAGDIGADNTFIYKQVLGLDDVTLCNLKSKGVI